MQFEKIKSQRGKYVIIENNYIYYYDKTINSAERWRCKTRGCSCMLLIIENIVKVVKSHNHESHYKAVTRMMHNNQMKKKAVETKEKAETIVVNETKNIKDEQLKYLTKHESMKKIIKRERHRKLGLGIIKFVDIPPQLQNDHQGNLFLRYDSGFEDTDRLLIFSSDFKKDLINNAKVLIIDGTFRTSPSDFYQLLIIHVFVFGKSYPVIYILMKNKKESNYIEAFKKINSIFFIKPDVVITDFEMGLSNAVELCFNGAENFFCLFHYAQSIYRHLKFLGLNSMYKENKNFSSLIKKIFNLPFLEAYRITDTFKLIEKDLFLFKSEEVQKFIIYYKKNYLGFFNDEGIYVDGFYSFKKWNCYIRVLENIPRTTNNAESWNKTFRQRCVVTHPNIAVVITELINGEELDRIEINQFKSGRVDLKRRNVLREEKIRLLIVNQKYIEAYTFLEALDDFFVWEFK